MVTNEDQRLGYKCTDQAPSVGCALELQLDDRVDACMHDKYSMSRSKYVVFIIVYIFMVFMTIFSPIHKTELFTEIALLYIQLRSTTL